MLLTIDRSQKGVTISGFIPFKGLDEDDLEKVSEIKLTITDKSGKIFTSQLQQPLAEKFIVGFSLNIHAPSNAFASGTVSVTHLRQ